MSETKSQDSITYDEFQRLLSNEPNKMYRIIYKTIWFLGLDVSEALNIRAKDIDFDKDQITIRGRYDRGRTLDLHPELKWALFEYRKEGKFDDDAIIFPRDRLSIYFALKKLGSVIGKKDISAKSLRRGFGKWFMQEGGDLTKLQQIYGHSNPSQTLRFVGMQSYGSKQFKTKTVQTINEMLTGKICEKCGQKIVKEVSLPPEKREISGLLCRRCYNNEKNRRRSRKHRLELLRILGGKCIRCGYDDWRALQLDHVSSDGVLDRRRFVGAKSLESYYSKHLEEAKQKLQLLCANCNFIKRHEELEFRYRRLV